MNISNKVMNKISDLAVKGEQFFFIIDFTGERSEVLTPAEAFKQGIYFDIEGNTNFSVQERDDAQNGKIQKKEFRIFPVPFNDYLVSFKKVQDALKRGDTYLMNLTFRTRIETKYSLEEIFRYSKARYKLLYKDSFVVFSPEKFISIRNGIIETRPMKGTISANIDGAEDKILKNPKELYEHNTIVDLLRNDLNIVATDVKVEKFRYVETLTTNKGDILQVSSVITGKLPDDYKNNMGEIIALLLPVGSVTGAPKERTIELINRIENYQRGHYAGIFGYFDGNNLEAAVSIRFIERSEDGMFYKSGGGITALSNPNEEYDELINKIYVPFF